MEYVLMLVGKTSHGKSATGNTILGIEEFQTRDSIFPCTKEVQQKSRKIMGNEVTVIDTPGFICDEHEISHHEATLSQRYLELTSSQTDSKQVLLFVMKASTTFENEDLHCLEIMERIFGTGFMEFCILVFTHGDYFEKECSDLTFENWCSQQNQAFKNLLEECNGRVVLFDNKTKDKSLREKQRSELMNLVHKVSAGGKRFGKENLGVGRPGRHLVGRPLPLTREEMTREGKTSLKESSSGATDKRKNRKTDVAFKKRIDTLSKRLDNVGEEEDALEDLSDIVRSIQGLILDEMKLSPFF